MAVTVDKHGSLCCLLGKACRSIGLTTCLHCFLVVVSLLFQVFSVSRRPFDHAKGVIDRRADSGRVRLYLCLRVALVGQRCFCLVCRRSTSRKGRHSAKAQLVLFPRTLDFIAHLICYAWRRLSFFVAVTVGKHGSPCCLLGKACRSIGLTTCLHCFLVVVSLLFQVFSVSRRPFDHAKGVIDRRADSGRVRLYLCLRVALVGQRCFCLVCRRSTSLKGRHSAKAQLVLFPRTLDFIAHLICYAWRRLSFFVAVTVDKHGSLCCLLGKACRSIGLTTCLHCFLVVVSLLFQVFSVSRRPFDHAKGVIDRRADSGRVRLYLC